MKVLLLNNIKGLGSKGDIKDVSEGYFRNMLAPRRLATLATGAAMKQMKDHQEKRIEKLENIKESALLIKRKIDGKSVTLAEKVHDNNKLYAAVNAKEIVEAIKLELKADVPEKAIQLNEAIKETGDSNVKIKLHPEVTAQITIHVTAQ